MMADALSGNGGSKMEAEGKFGVEFGSGEDRNAVEVDDVKPGERAADSALFANGGTKDELLLQSDPDQKEDRWSDYGNNDGGGMKDSVVDDSGVQELVNISSAKVKETSGGDQDTGNGKEENRELSSDNGDVNELAIDSNANSEFPVVHCEEIKPSSYTKEDHTESESKYFREENKDLHKENGESEVKGNVEVSNDLREENGETLEFCKQESDENDGLCEKNENGVLRETAEVKVKSMPGFENGQFHSAAAAANGFVDKVIVAVDDEKTDYTCEEDPDSAVEPRENQERVTVITEVNSESERESESAELEGYPAAAITVIDDLGQSAFTIGGERDGLGAKYYDARGYHLEQSKSPAQEDCLDEVMVITVTGKEKQPELEPAILIEEKQVSENAIGDPDDQIEEEEDNTVEEKLDVLTLSSDASQDEQSESALDEVTVTTVTENEQQPELETAVLVEEKQVSEIAIRDPDDQIEEEEDNPVKEKLDDLTMSAYASRDEQSELVLHAEEEQLAQNLVSDTSEQLELEPVASTELLQRPQAIVAEASELADTKSITEGEQEQMPESIVIEKLASESPVRHRELSLETSACGDECCDKSDTLPEASDQTNLCTQNKSASDENHEDGSIFEFDGKNKKAETSENLVSADCSDGLHLNSMVSHGHKDSCGNSDRSHCFSKGLVEENAIALNAIEAVAYESNRPTALDEASILVTEGDVSSVAIEPCEYGPPADMVKKSSSNPSIESGTEVEIGLLYSERMFSGDDNDEDVKDKICVDVDIAGSNLHIDHIVTGQSESMTANESLQFGDSSAHLDQSTSANKSEEAVSIELIHTGPDDQSASAMDDVKVGTPIPKRKPCYIIKVPKFNNDELWTRIQCAQTEMDQKTESRDLIKVSMQNQKATCSEYREKFRAAREEENIARLSFQSARDKLGPIQAMMYKLKNAHSLGEIDDKIQKIEFTLQHETMHLKEEKKCIHELKLLRQQREQLSHSMAPKEEIDEAYNQKEQLNERQKALMKELDSLRTSLLGAEANTRAAEAKYDGEQNLLSDLRKQFHAANDIRQKAYAHWRDLKNESVEKNKYFQMYRKDRRDAENYASLGDIQGLLFHCSKQVEGVMNLWNNDEQFRKQYVESNKSSTLRRLKTLDGRSLAPDEEPPILHYDSRFSRFSLPSAAVCSTMPPHPEAKLESSEEDQFPALEVTQESKPAKAKISTKPISKESKQTKAAVVLNRGQEASLEQEEDNVMATGPTREEEELARKAEELARKEEKLRKEKAAAELKEQHRLEQRHKAKEAEERKRRQAEKAQARAEYRAKKEAELREKKRAKKKKLIDDVDAINGRDGVTAPSTSNSLETSQSQVVDIPTATTSKRPSGTVVAAKPYNKVQLVPLPLRNRGKRKHPTWLWVLLSTLVVLGLFLAGNYLSSHFSIPQFGF